MFTGNYDQDRAAAARWAWEQLQEPDTLILDTETTGLDSDAEICQIGLMSVRGDVLLDNVLVKPTRPIPAAAERIHGIATKAVAFAITFKDLAVDIRRMIDGRRVVIFNREYDYRLLRQSALAYGLDAYAAIPSSASFECAMLPYSAWVGEWNAYYASYRWQRLPGGDHSALGDCRATRRLLFEMAGLSWLCDPSHA